MGRLSADDRQAMWEALYDPRRDAFRFVYEKSPGRWVARMRVPAAVGRGRLVSVPGGPHPTREAAAAAVVRHLRAEYGADWVLDAVTDRGRRRQLVRPAECGGGWAVTACVLGRWVAVPGGPWPTAGAGRRATADWLRRAFPLFGERVLVYGDWQGWPYPPAHRWPRPPRLTRPRPALFAA